METIHLNPEELTAESRSDAMAHGNVPVVLSLSSFDVPRAINVERNDPTLLRITFQYVDYEARVDRSVGPDLIVWLGKDSGKVLGFELKRVPHQKPRDVIVRIVHGVDEQLRRATRDNQRLNYALIKRVLERRVEPALA